MQILNAKAHTNITPNMGASTSPYANTDAHISIHIRKYNHNTILRKLI